MCPCRVSSTTQPIPGEEAFIFRYKGFSHKLANKYANFNALSALLSYEDLNQTGLLRLLIIYRRHKGDPEKLTASYVFTSVHNAIVEAVRKVRGMRYIKELPSSVVDVDSLNLYDPVDYETRINAALDVSTLLKPLKPHVRRLIKLQHIDGLSEAELNEKTHVSISNIKTLKHRSFIQIRERMKKDFRR